VKKPNVAASIRARLLKLARERQQNFDLVLTRFCLERLLYRISISSHNGRFLLKGAMLFDLWFDISHRPTRDIDFLGLGSSEISDIENSFREICSIDVSDGVVFESDSIRTVEIRNETNYPGVRVWSTVSCACNAPNVIMNTWSRSVASGVDSALVVVQGAWQKAPHCWSMRFCRNNRYANG
jgi:hypothetical protein